MAANNETGVIQPFQEIGRLAHEHGTLFFSDTTQIIGKDKFNFEESNMDFAVLSGHKIGALIGSGLILAKDKTMLSKDFIFGGGQEHGLRGGTQNYIGVETLAVALDSFEKNMMSRVEELASIRQNFEKNIKAKYPQAVIVGADAPRLATTTLISLPGIHGQAVQIELESNDIFVTTSSACSDNEPETSKVLKSMNIDDQVGRGVVRISLCCGVGQEAYDKIEKSLLSAYEKLSKLQY